MDNLRIELPPETPEQAAARDRAQKLMDNLTKQVQQTHIGKLEREAEAKVRVIAQEEVLRVLSLGTCRFTSPAGSSVATQDRAEARLAVHEQSEGTETAMHAVHVEAYRSGRRVGLLDARRFLEQRSARLGTTYEQKVALVSVLADINGELDRSALSARPPAEEQAR